MREAMPLPQSMQSQLAQAKMDRTVQAATQLAALPPMLELRDGVLGAVRDRITLDNCAGMCTSSESN